MNKLSNKKIIAISIVVIISIVSLVFFINHNKKKEQLKTLPVKELPLKIETTPIEFNVVSNDVENILECSYTNNSKKDIIRLSLDVKFKDTGEVVTLKSDEVVKVGAKSSIFTSKAPASGNKEDVEILKYKISTSDGTYMEYDTNLKQYNWS